MLESAIDRLPALPLITRTKHSATERSSIDGAIFPRRQRQNKRISHTLTRFRPVDATILTAKETETKRSGIDQVAPNRGERLNARGLLAEGTILRRAVPMTRGLR